VLFFASSWACQVSLRVWDANPPVGCDGTPNRSLNLTADSKCQFIDGGEWAIGSIFEETLILTVFETSECDSKLVSAEPTKFQRAKCVDLGGNSFAKATWTCSDSIIPLANVSTRARCKVGRAVGECHSRNSTACGGRLFSGFCPNKAASHCCIADPVADAHLLRDAAAVAAFADNNWNCADVACDQTVPAGSPQPNYACAEFASRSLAAGGYLSGLGPYDDQSAYAAYGYNGNTYDLCWVASDSGGPLGLKDYCIAAGYSQVGSVDAAVVGIVNGGDGPDSHAVIGVAPDTFDAHNNARYHVPTSYYDVNSLWASGGSPTGGLVEDVTLDV